MATRPLPLDDVMMILKGKALEREEKLADSADAAGGETGAIVDEHADTWGFSWMPAIEEFVEQAAAVAQEEADCSSAHETPTDEGDEKEAAGDAGGVPGRWQSSVEGAVGNPASVSFKEGARNRKRMRSSGGSDGNVSKGQPPPPSYNEILLADKSFHNPHGWETMASAFGIIRPVSFMLEVADDDRTWGGPATAAMTTGDRRGEQGVPKKDVAVEEDEEREKGSQSWFYDTVRDRQNRLWADTRIKKGVELARKGQHQLAIDTYSQALGMCPDHEDGLVARGAAFATMGRLRQALQDLSRALSLNPNNENASSYLKETRRRMDRQDAKVSPSPSVSSTGGQARDHGLKPWDTSSRDRSRVARSADSAGLLGGGGGAGSTLSSSQGNGSDETSRSVLAALIHDGVEGDTLRKMKLLLEEDERTRKQRRRKSVGGAGEGRGRGDEGASSSSSDGGGSGSLDSSTNNRGRHISAKKKTHKKSKKSSKSSRRSSSHHHKKNKDRERRRDSSAGHGSSSDEDSAGGGGGAAGRTSNSSATNKHKKKKKRRSSSSAHKKKRHSRGVDTDGIRSMSPPPRAAAVAGSSSGGEGSGGDAVHPILQRKKHSLWG